MPGYRGLHQCTSRNVNGMVILNARTRSTAANRPDSCNARKLNRKIKRMVFGYPALSQTTPPNAFPAAKTQGKSITYGLAAPPLPKPRSTIQPNSRIRQRPVSQRRGTVVELLSGVSGGPKPSVSVCCVFCDDTASDTVSIDKFVSTVCTATASGISARHKRCVTTAHSTAQANKNGYGPTMQFNPRASPTAPLETKIPSSLYVV